MQYERRKCRLVKAWGGGRAVVSALLLACGPLLMGAEPGNSLERKAAELRREVLNDPANQQKQEVLGDLLRYQRRQERGALDALAKGLEAYVEVGPCAANLWFQGALCSSQARSLTAQSLGVTLEELMAECNPADGGEAGGPGGGGPGWQDCGVCSSTGARVCQTCEGRGRAAKEESGEEEVCGKCGGTGGRFCMSCSGYGIVKCRKCAGRGYMRAGKPRAIDPKRRAAIQRLISQAGYLYRGGIDFSTGHALRTTPRSSGTAGWDASGGAGGSSEAANQRLWQELMRRIAEGPTEEAKTEPAP